MKRKKRSNETSYYEAKRDEFKKYRQKISPKFG
jgi:hypothetical protein